jgi:hypothetical protein
MENYLATNKSRYVIAAVFAMALYSSCALADNLPEVQHAGDIAYISGGIGDEERAALRAVQKDYNLHVLSAGVKGGYVGDAHMVISDSHGQEVIHAIVGPLFYAKLPPGHYVVTEERHEKSKKQSIVIADKTVSITFRWKKPTVATP